LRLHERARFKDEVAVRIAGYYQSSGDLEKSLAWMGKILEPAARALYESSSLKQLGRREDAVRSAREAVSLAPAGAATRQKRWQSTPRPSTSTRATR
jgi:hypothetical protein